MSNEEALQILSERDRIGVNIINANDAETTKYNNDSIEALSMAIEALKAEPCEDAVSREAVLDKIKEVCFSKEQQWVDFRVAHGSNGQRDFIINFIESLSGVRPKTGWIPLTWDESKCESSYPDDMDGCWAIFTDGKNISIERGKKDAFDHFFPSGRWFNMSEAIAWMPLPKYEKGE